MQIFISILVLQLLIVALGVLLGYKRGTGRGIVRLVELLIIGGVSLVLGRMIANKLAGTAWSLILPLLGEDVNALIAASPSIEPLLIGFVGALVVPFLFATFFAILGLISTILMKKRGKAIVKLATKSDEEPQKKSRLVGMAIGAVSSALVALALFSPTYTAISLIGGLSDESIALIGGAVAPAEVEAPAENGDAALAVRPSLLAPGGTFNIAEFLMEIRTAGNTAATLSLKLTVATTPDGSSYNAIEEAVAITNAVSAALKAIQAEPTPAPDGSVPASKNVLDTITQAATVALPHIAGQPFAKELVVTAANAVGTHIQNGGEIAGISKNSGDVIVDIMIESLSEVFTQTTTENLSDTTNTLFGVDLNKLEEEKKAEKDKGKDKNKNKDKDKDKNKDTTTAAPETTKTPETSTPGSEVGSDETSTPDSSTETETSSEPETSEKKDPEKEAAAQGALSILASVNFNDATGLFEDETQSRKLIEAVYILDANPTFAPVIKALGRLGGHLVQENKADLLPGQMSHETLEPLHAQLIASMKSVSATDPLSVKVASIKSSIYSAISEYKYEVTSTQVELGAIVIVAYFYTPENLANPDALTYGEFRSFLNAK